MVCVNVAVGMVMVKSGKEVETAGLYLCMCGLRVLVRSFSRNWLVDGNVGLRSEVATGVLMVGLEM